MNIIITAVKSKLDFDQKFKLNFKNFNNHVQSIYLNKIHFFYIQNH